MNGYNDYGFREQSTYWSMGQQIRFDVNHLRKDVSDAIKEQTQVQSEDAEKTRTNQTTLVGKIIETVKSIFTGNNDSGAEESFFKMVMRENNETQAYLESQANSQKTTIEKLGSIISSLNDISSEIENNTNGDKTNATAITNAIKNLKLIVNT